MSDDIVILQGFDEWGSGSFQLYECGFLPKANAWHFDQLCNPYWRFYYNSEEGNSIEIDSRQIAIRPDEVMIIPENTLFNARCSRNVPHFWIHFAPPLTLRLAEGQYCFPLDSCLMRSITELKERLTANPQSKVERLQIFHLCLAVLHRFFGRASLCQEPPYPPALKRVLEMIERSLSSSLCNEDLARVAGMNRDSFIRWFKAFMRITPARYVTHRRIREACRHLSLSNHSIKQIAESLGFADRHHFTRLFVREMGRGPAEFRRISTATREFTLS